MPNWDKKRADRGQKAGGSGTKSGRVGQADNNLSPDKQISLVPGHKAGENQEVRTKDGDLVAVMANTVAEARHALTVPEQRLVLWLVSQIARDDDCFRDHVLSVLEMEEILGGNNGRLYEQIEEVCDRLQTRVLEVRNFQTRERVKFNWMLRVRYQDQQGKVAMQFHPDLAPVLLQLKERFCQIPLRAVFRLRGGYSIRWLEMCHARRHVRSWTMSAGELRDWLHVAPDELVAVKDLRARAIDYPKKELDAKSHLTFTYVPKYEGRRIVGWTFTVKPNKPLDQQRPLHLHSSPAEPTEEERAAGRAHFAEIRKNLKQKP